MFKYDCDFVQKPTAPDLETSMRSKNFFQLKIKN